RPWAGVARLSAHGAGSQCAAAVRRDQRAPLARRAAGAAAARRRADRVGLSAAAGVPLRAGRLLGGGFAAGSLARPPAPVTTVRQEEHLTLDGAGPPDLRYGQARR